MSDQPPKPKPGSLRDRIAAFEKAGTSAPAPAPPPVRPKPAGFSSWKPKAPSPPSSPTTSENVPAKPPVSAGMSAADAKDSIVKAGSLKDRMAALQGKGGFGVPPPVAPKPPMEKPKWKPPPVISPPVDENDSQEPSTSTGAAAVPASPPLPVRDDSLKSEESAVKEDTEAAETPASADADPEEEERQRRAAIAARLARLGGTRVGMAPVFGKPAPPPPAKKPSLPPQETSAKVPTSPPPTKVLTEEPQPEADAVTIPEVASPPAEPSVTSPSDKPAADMTAAIVPSASVESAESHGSRSPPSMPVPAVPRRAAPPRKKAKAPSQPVPPEPVEAPVVSGVPEAKEEQPAPAPSPVKAEVPEEEDSTVAKNTEPSLSQADEDKPEDNGSDKDDVADAVSGSKGTEPLADAKAEIPMDVEPSPLKVASEPEDEEEPAVLAYRKEEEGVKEPEAIKETAPADEDVEDEETRRKKVAERLAKMGGVNPFALPPPVRKSSTSSNPPTSPPPPVRKSSTSSIPTSSPPPARKSSTSSITPAPLQSEEAKPSKLEGVPSDDEEGPGVKEEPPKMTTPPREESGQNLASKLLDQEEGSDDGSPYDDQDAQESSTKPAKEPIRQDAADRLQPRSVPTIPIPPPPASPPKASVPQNDPDSDPAQSDSEEENEDLVRSQILKRPPPPSFPPPPPALEEDEDDSDGLPPPVARPASFSSSQATPDKVAEEPHSHQGPPRRNLPPPPPPVPQQDSDEESEYDDDSENDAAPVPQASSPVIVPPTPNRRPPVPQSGPPPRQLPQPPVHHSTSQSSLRVPPATEVLSEEEGDPIDPSFHSPSRRASAILPSSTTITPPEESEIAAETNDPEPSEAQDTKQAEEDAEAARRRTIAERMAKLGGIKFGAAPPVPSFKQRSIPQPPVEGAEESQSQEAQNEDQPELTEEEEERARKERIAAKLAGMGGMRIGMMPQAFPVRKPTLPQQDAPIPVVSKSPPARAPPPPSRAAPPPRAPDSESERDSLAMSDDVVEVEAEESEIEEVRHEDVPPPPVPDRSARPVRRKSQDSVSSPPPPARPSTRPPVPNVRRSSTQTSASQRRTSGDSATFQVPKTAVKGQSEYVMVEEPENDDEPPPLPSNRPGSGRPPTRAPPPPAEPQDSLSSQWELPTIPTSTLEFGQDDLSMSWTEAHPEESGPVPLEESITIIPGQRRSSLQVQPAKPHEDVQLSSDELMTVWGRVGVQVCEAATNLFEKSKKALVGDGTYPGFVRSVLREVPNSSQRADWGYLIYKQSGASVQKRASDVLPGDLVELTEAKFKGHKGLHAYSQVVGAEEPLIGVISEFDPKKSKMRVFQANQSVGQQTVESVSYRLDDLKSGVMKVYRVLEA